MVLRMVTGVGVLLTTWHPAKDRDMRARCAVKQQQERNADADEKAGKRIEEQDAEQRGYCREEISAGRDAVDAAQASRVIPIQANDGRYVYQLNESCDDHDR